MAALAETSSNVTEFAGKFKLACVEVDLSSVTGTTGTVTIDEMSAVLGAVVSLKGIGTTWNAHINVICSTNVCTLVPMTSAGTVCSIGTNVDCYLIAFGY